MEERYGNLSASRKAVTSIASRSRRALIQVSQRSGEQSKEDMEPIDAEIDGSFFNRPSRDIEACFTSATLHSMRTIVATGTAYSCCDAFLLKPYLQALILASYIFLLILLFCP